VEVTHSTLIEPWMAAELLEEIEETDYESGLWTVPAASCAKYKPCCSHDAISSSYASTLPTTAPDKKPESAPLVRGFLARIAEPTLLKRFNLQRPPTRAIYPCLNCTHSRCRLPPATRLPPSLPPDLSPTCKSAFSTGAHHHPTAPSGKAATVTKRKSSGWPYR